MRSSATAADYTIASWAMLIAAFELSHRSVEGS
jgi:hypothetical protein